MNENNYFLKNAEKSKISPKKTLPISLPIFQILEKNTAKITPKFGKIWGQENPRLCLGPKHVWGQFSLMLVLYTPDILRAPRKNPPSISLLPLATRKKI